MGLLNFFLGLIAPSGKKGPKVHYRAGKIDKVNAWKSTKKKSGKWLPHDEYVKRKRGR